jgi:cell division protein YceG involved in septum cleavage
MNSNEFKKVIIYMLAVMLTTFAICVCFEVYYLKQELSEMYQHNNQLLELRVIRLEEILE